MSVVETKNIKDCSKVRKNGARANLLQNLNRITIPTNFPAFLPVFILKNFLLDLNLCGSGSTALIGQVTPKKALQNRNNLYNGQIILICRWELWFGLLSAMYPAGRQV